ncbi:MAG: nucleotide pyrophosphohydrolase [Actinomycetaceae bacterium]|nr:nucleotide pyrophosphohydrolase [Actinomycetaceae bacterium]
MTNHNDLAELTTAVVEFRDARNWKQFHNAKDLAISLNLEAAELLECFQWKTSEEAIAEQRAAIEDEIADVLLYLLLLAEHLDIDLPAVVCAKIAKNNEKYPVDKARDNRAKYTEL